ncbi:MAG: hypothetical protein O2899_07540, partial [Bacteroidetes bacterium]|nr:hypothetical protein [Bacteroidota bacterium]
ADGNMEERLKVMFELADAVQIQGDSASYHFHFSQDEHGIHVVLDPAMAARLESGSAQSLYRNLERREWIKWQDNLARDQARSEERMKAQAARLARIESALSAGADVPGVRAVDRWASAQKLAMLGATVNMDTTLLNREIGTLLKQLTLELDSLQGSSVRVIVQHEAAKSGRSGN